MDLISSFTQIFSTSPALLACAPGRVNLLGEHVDYNDGVVLPAALDRAVHFAAAPSADGAVHLEALDLGERVSFRLEDLDAKVTTNGNTLPGWACYPAGVAWSLREAGVPVAGMQAAYTSNVPIGSGLSSSAAVEVGFAVLWQALGGWEMDRMTLARRCQRAENAYVGVNSGLMDQFASAHGVEGHALFFDTRSLEWRPAPLPPGMAIVVADSGMRRSLASSAYNDRRAACEKAVELLRQYLPQIRSLRDVSPQEFAAYSVYLPETVRKRAEHIVKEIARVESAVNALQREDAHAFGALMFAGHASLRDLYEVSIPELDALVSIARRQPGCLGARLTGAGFGGCTVNLVEAGLAQEFIQGLTAGYQEQTGRQAQVYLCRASAGASVEWL
jgi:galactokinase